MKRALKPNRGKKEKIKCKGNGMTDRYDEVKEERNAGSGKYSKWKEI